MKLLYTLFGIFLLNQPLIAACYDHVYKIAGDHYIGTCFRLKDGNFMTAAHVVSESGVYRISNHTNDIGHKVNVVWQDTKRDVAVLKLVYPQESKDFASGRFVIHRQRPVIEQSIRMAGYKGAWQKFFVYRSVVTGVDERSNFTASFNGDDGMSGSPVYEWKQGVCRVLGVYTGTFAFDKTRDSDVVWDVRYKGGRE